jgi:hypothetical protein
MIAIIGAGVVGQVIAKALEEAQVDYELFARPDRANTSVKGKSSDVLGDIFKATATTGSFNIWGGVLFIDKRWFTDENEAERFLLFVLRHFEILEVYNYYQEFTLLHAKCRLKQITLNKPFTLKEIGRIDLLEDSYCIDESIYKEVVLATGAVSTPKVRNEYLQLCTSLSWEDKYIDLVPCSREEFIENISYRKCKEKLFVDVPVYLPLGNSLREKELGFKFIMLRSGLYKLRMDDILLLPAAFRILLNIIRGKRFTYYFRTVSHKSSYPVRLEDATVLTAIKDVGVMLAYHASVIVDKRTKLWCVSEFEEKGAPIIAGNPVAKRIYNIWKELILKGYYL